jgi:hypothetical protein
VKAPLAFTLCATFETSDSEVSGGKGATVPSKAYPGEIGGGNWKHEAGETCFDRTIDPELYPLLKK